MFSSSLDYLIIVSVNSNNILLGNTYICWLQGHHSSVRVGNKGGNNRVGIGESIGIGESSRNNNLGISITLLTGITSRVMDISLSLRRAVIRNITGGIVDIGGSLRRAVISDITASIVYVSFSDRVDKTSVKSIVSYRDSSIGQGIGVSTQAIPVRKDYR